MNKLFFYFIFIVFGTVLNADQDSLKPNENLEGRKKALIFGVTGQDGTYLTEFLLNKNYEVHGVARHAAMPGKTPGKSFQQDSRYRFYTGDIANFSTVVHLLDLIQPDEVYNLAAQSRVKISFDLPEDTAEINAIGTLRILEGIRMLGLEKKVKFFQASSSEIFGTIQDRPQTEKSVFHPRSPYGVAKLYGFWITVNYRESYGIFSCNGILFNHESPIRGESFVSKKISLAACRYSLGLQDVLYLGDLDVKRDWGFAKDYVEAMWLMLQQDEPNDYIVATGETHSVREFVELAFKHLDIEIEWQGHGVDECGLNKKTGDIVIRIDPMFYRPNEVAIASGNPEKAEKVLQWKSKTSFSELVKIMVDADLKVALNEQRSDH